MTTNALRGAPASAERFRERIGSSVGALADALEDSRTTVKQMVKTTRNKAEDLLDDTAHSIRRAPLSSVMVAFGIGAVLGAAIALAASRK